MCQDCQMSEVESLNLLWPHSYNAYVSDIFDSFEILSEMKCMKPKVFCSPACVPLQLLLTTMDQACLYVT